MTLPPRVSDLTAFDLLLTVARMGSLGRAAAEHGISQPAASARMRQLEGQVGLALIDRSPRGSRLTPSGALVAGWAQAAVDAAADLDAGITALRHDRDCRLRIAASMTVAEYLLPTWLTSLRAVDPEAAVALTAANSAEVAQEVLADDADIGYLEEALRGQAGAELVPALAELSSTTAIKAAVAAGAGPAVLSSLAVAAEVSAGTLRTVTINGLDLHRRLQAVWAAGRRLSGPARDLYAIAARPATRGS